MEDLDKEIEVAEKKPNKSKKRARKSTRRRQLGATKLPVTRPYPRVPLEKAILVAKAIKDMNGGNPWPAQDIATVLGVSSKGVGFVYSLLSSQKFGLTEGASAKGQVSLTGLGRQLVYSGSAEEEQRAKRSAFLSVPVFRDVLEHYNGS